MNYNDIKTGAVFECETKAGTLVREVIGVDGNTVTFDTRVHDDPRELSMEDFLGVLEMGDYELVEAGEDDEDDEDEPVVDSVRYSGPRQIGTQFHDRSAETAMDGRGPRGW